MMRLKNLIVEGTDIPERLLAHWGYDEDSVRFWRVSSNIVFAFKQNGERKFLRYAPEEEKTWETIAAELEFLNHLKWNRYPAAYPVISRNGKTIETVETPEGRYFGVVFNRAKGRMLEIEQMTQEQLEGWGQSLASLHQLSQSFTPSGHVRKSWKEQLEFVRRVMESHPGEASALEELQRVQAWLGTLPVTPETYGLVHYDFETDNIFWDDEAKGFTAIDFDDAVYHWYALDITSALTDLSKMEKMKAEAGLRAFLRGYRSIRPIEEAFINQMPLFQRYCDLVKHARILRSLENCDLEREPEWYEKLKARFYMRCEERRKGFEKPWELIK